MKNLLKHNNLFFYGVKYVKCLPLDYFIYSTSKRTAKYITAKYLQIKKICIITAPQLFRNNIKLETNIDQCFSTGGS